MLEKAPAVKVRQALEEIGESFARRTSENIEVIVPDYKNPTYGLFVPNMKKHRKLFVEVVKISFRRIF